MSQASTEAAIGKHQFPVLRHCSEYTNHIWFVFQPAAEDSMGLVKIDDALHEEARRASTIMCRSINAQAEFWMKIGMLAEANPTLSFTDIVKMQFELAQVRVTDAMAA